MSRALRSVLVLLLASSVLVVVPGEVDATVPGDIGRIVFVSNRDHAYGEIYVRDFAGSTATRLTNNTLEDFGPKWSPDGARIAFNQNIGTEMVPQVDIHVLDADGSNEINLTNNPAIDDWFHDWSPDGMRIVPTLCDDFVSPLCLGVFVFATLRCAMALCLCASVVKKSPREC